MKKFMKAIAFVTVMCMALSTVAFAANEGILTKVDEKTLDVTVTAAGPNEQVALYIVAESATASTADTPLFIDQKGADNAGRADFTAKFDGTVEAVRVFVGYAANTSGSAVDLGAVTLKEAVTKVTVTKANVTLLKEKQAESDIGQIYTVAFDVEAPQGSTVTATNMIWAITYTDEVNNVTDTVYSEAVDASGYGIGAVMDGAVTLAVAFNNGSVGRDLDSVDIDTIDAIFLFSDGSEAATDDFSDDDSRNISGGN